MTLSTNNFDENKPTKSSGVFASASTPASNTFVDASPIKSTDIFSGDDTSGGVFGGDFATWGNLYGQDPYGGLVHFQNRPPLPTITHT